MGSTIYMLSVNVITCNYSIAMVANHHVLGAKM